MTKSSSKPLTVSEEAAEFIQKLLKISRGVDNFYERLNDDGTTSLVFQTPAEALVLDLHKVYPALPKVSEPRKTPNLCNSSCKEDLVRFIDLGIVTTPLRCSTENPPRPRVRDGCLEYSCIWSRMYHDMARKPSEVETLRRHASELMDSTLKLPVLDLHVGPDVWMPTLDSKLVYERAEPTESLEA